MTEVHTTDQSPADALLTHEDTSTPNRCLSRAQVLHILALKRTNPSVTQQAIADAVGCDRSTVSRWLATYSDTIDDARNVLNAGALEAAVRVTEWVKSDDARASMDASKTVLKAAKLLEDESKSAGNVAIQVVIGMPGAPAGPDPFDVVDSKGTT